jgi:hypothetical protein
MIGKEKDTAQDAFLKEYYLPDPDSKEESRISEIGIFLSSPLAFSGRSEELFLGLGELIRRVTEFEEISFGVLEDDGMYRYHGLLGYGEEAAKARCSIVYDSKDISDGVAFKSIRTGRNSHIYLSEYTPFKPGEEATFNHPELLGKPRKNADDMIEGDYLDIFLYGKQKKVIGWIELSGPRNGKLPTRDDILYLEYLASCLVLSMSIAPKNASNPTQSPSSN